jgi:hypothetical protein
MSIRLLVTMTIAPINNAQGIDSDIAIGNCSAAARLASAAMQANSS